MVKRETEEPPSTGCNSVSSPAKLPGDTSCLQSPGLEGLHWETALGTTSTNCKRDTEESQEHVCACRVDLIISLIWQFTPKASGKILKKKRLLQMILDLRFVSCILSDIQPLLNVFVRHDHTGTKNTYNKLLNL